MLINAHDVAAMARVIGSQVLVPMDRSGCKVLCKVVQIKPAYGRVILTVSPVAGQGQTNVAAESCSPAPLPMSGVLA